MTDSQQRAAYYRKLFARLDPAEARDLIDRLQILALTRPDTVKELETFLERDEPPAAPRKDEASDVAPVPARHSGR
jgi:DNA-directed RNA polymerase subunit F